MDGGMGGGSPDGLGEVDDIPLLTGLIHAAAGVAGRGGRGRNA